MGLSIAPTQDDIFEILGDFITNVLSPGVVVIQGQINRTAEPAADDFVVMWPLRFPRLATNIDEYIDAVFTGSISGTTLDITAVNDKFTGTLKVGSTILGVGVATGTVITALGSGSGGVGTYTVNNSQTVNSETLAAGTGSLTQKAECVMQVDVHGLNSESNAQIISTTFRDYYATNFFTNENPNIAPLYADNPEQRPFLNAEQQWEDRYVIEVHMQVNQTVVVPQDFAQQAEVGVVSVDATYPPT